MPLAPLTPNEQKQFPEPCRDPQHDPPGMMVIVCVCKWVCPACGASVILRPFPVDLLASWRKINNMKCKDSGHTMQPNSGDQR